MLHDGCVVLEAALQSRTSSLARFFTRWALSPKKSLPSLSYDAWRVLPGWSQSGYRITLPSVGMDANIFLPATLSPYTNPAESLGLWALRCAFHFISPETTISRALPGQRPLPRPKPKKYFSHARVEIH